MKKYLIIAILVLLIPGIARAQDLQLTAGQTINISLTSPSVTYIISSTTGIDSLVANNSTLTLTLSAGDNVTVFNGNGYQIVNNLGQATSCGGLTTSITFTQTVTITSSTTSCSSSGGGGSTLPNYIEVKINNSSVETTDRKVTLSLSASDALSMMLSNDSSFAGVSWEPFAKTKNWTLTEGFGQKTVYAKFMSSTGGVSSAVNATIKFVESISKITPKEENKEIRKEEKKEVKPEIPQGNLEGKIVKEPGKQAVYLVENKKLRPYLNGRIFEAHGKKFFDVIETPLESYSIGEGVNIFPDSYNFTCGQLVKASNAKVYIVSRCEVGMPKEILWIKTEESFLNGGWSFKNINNISDAKKAEFAEIEPFEGLYNHPAGSLVKYGDSSKVYLLQKVDGVIKKRWVATEGEFNARKFQFNDIVILLSKEIYPDGDSLGGAVLGVEYNESFVSDLSLGSNGDEVLALQNLLQGLGYFSKNVAPNGNFGPVTKKALVEFQKTYGLERSGRVDIKTRHILNNLKIL